MKDLLGEVIITGLCLGYSLIRLTMGLIISILLSLAIGILAARNKSVERVIIPLLDVLQSVPILGFFPAVVYLFIYLNPYLGAELAAIVLIVTSQMWNLTFGVYEAIKTLPKDLLEVSEVLKLNLRYKNSFNNKFNCNSAFKGSEGVSEA